MCETMRGRVYPLDVFVSSGFYPGFHNHCDCSLRRVDPETPDSPMDLFPDYFVTNLGMFGSFINRGWKNYNVFILDEFMRATKNGETINDAIARFKAGDLDDGSILPYPKWKSILESLGMYGWFVQMRDMDSRLKVYVNMFEGITGDYSGPSGITPKPEVLRPVLPDQSYYYPHVPSGDIYSNYLGF